jgi:hypothetical protein
MSFDVKWRHAEKELRRIVDTDPSLGPVVRELVARQKANDQYNAEYILFDVFSLKPGLTPAGFQDPRPLWARAKWVKDSPQSK